jgi:tRNA dimethylallyltransferase
VTSSPTPGLTWFNDVDEDNVYFPAINGLAEAVLHERIAARVQAMFDQGLVEEVQRLLETYGTLSRTASIAVGYREVIAMLRGEINRAEAIEQVIAHTRQLARRQETWLRSLQGLQTLHVTAPADLDRLPPRIVQSVSTA